MEDSRQESIGLEYFSSMYRIAFYENGQFTSYMGMLFESKSDAISALTSYSLNVTAAGLDVKFVGADCFTYDRYGTPCAIRIEEASV